MDANLLLKDLIKSLSTPRDSSTMDNKTLAGLLTLSFIGYCARPSNIPKPLLEKCIEAFNANRGKTEIEEEAVYNAIVAYGRNVCESGQ